MEPTTLGNNSTPPPHHRGRFLPILIIIIFLILIGGGVLAYTVVFEAPPAALTKSLATIAGARSFHQDIAVKAVSELPTALTAEGMVAVDVEQKAAGGAPNRSAIVIGGKSGGFSVSAELRFIDNTLYGKINEFPFLSFISSSATDSPIGKWYAVSLDDLENYAVEQGIPADNIAKTKAQLSQFDVSDVISQVDALIQAGVLVPGARAFLLRADGAWARQYTVAIGKERLIDFIVAKQKELSANVPMAATIDSQTAADSLKSVTFDPVIVTIDLLDHSLKKITGGIKVSGRGSVSFAITYRDINGPITVTKPDNAISLIDYIQMPQVEPRG